MSRLVRITVLVENTAGGSGLLGEHGMAFWVEAGSRRILFDTGQGMVLQPNAARLGISLAQTDTIVLSHGHYDHTGGLAGVLKIAPQATVVAHPAAFKEKYHQSGDGTPRSIGIVLGDEDEVRNRASDVILTERPREICEGVFVTGEIPRTTDFEDTGGAFFLDEACREPDRLLDDQAVFFDTKGGTVVLLGCAHSGVINTLRYVRQLTDNKPMYAVMGGTHLIGASEDRLNRTVEELAGFDIDLLGPCHCTGMAGMARIWAAFPGKCIGCMVGKKMELELS